ncbi:hypothetical protein ABW19_dt0207091 [Dactylella cylindrospora]|nr:hypothetical protein ABW19_dt0207091 [Dactylella cylindrospora]
MNRSIGRGSVLLYFVPFPSFLRRHFSHFFRRVDSKILKPNFYLFAFFLSLFQFSRDELGTTGVFSLLTSKKFYLLFPSKVATSPRSFAVQYFEVDCYERRSFLSHGASFACYLCPSMFLYIL